FSRHVRAAPHLDVVAAREVELLLPEPPRHVQMHAAHAVVVVRHVVRHLGNEAGHIRPGGVGDVLPDRAARVGQAVRIQAGPGVPRQPGGLHGARGPPHDAGAHMAVGPGGLVAVGDPGGDRHVRARVVVLAASALESTRLLLNSRSGLYPNGLANASGTVGKYITDTTGTDVAGFIPKMTDHVPHNHDGVGGMHLYMPWW